MAKPAGLLMVELKDVKGHRVCAWPEDVFVREVFISMSNGEHKRRTYLWCKGVTGDVELSETLDEAVCKIQSVRMHNEKVMRDSLSRAFIRDVPYGDGNDD